MIPPEEQVVKADDVYADSSNTESDSDVRTLKYLGDYPELPIDAPVDCPHIIDLDSLDHEYFYLQGIGIADAVATILFKFMPAALAAFLDLDCPKFHYIQADQAASRLDFCIKRDGCMVTVRYSHLILSKGKLTNMLDWIAPREGVQGLAYTVQLPNRRKVHGCLDAGLHSRG